MKLMALCPICHELIPEPFLEEVRPWHLLCGSCGRLWKVDLKIDEIFVRGNGMTTYLVQKASRMDED